MGSDCDSQLPPILTTDEQPMDLEFETATNEVKDQSSHMEDIQTVVEQSGYVPPFFIVAPPMFVFGVIVIRRRRTYAEAFPEEKQRYIPSKKCKREVPSQGHENDNANPFRCQLKRRVFSICLPSRPHCHLCYFCLQHRCAIQCPTRRVGYGERYPGQASHL